MSRIHCDNWNSTHPQYLTDARTGKTLGQLMPIASRKTIEASPGIQAWSSPRGKMCTEMMNPESVIDFATHWEQKWHRTYPLSS